MATISWGTLKSLLIFFGPILLPKAISYYRSIRSAPQHPGLGVRPLPALAFRGISILATTAVVFLIASLPVFAPENVFARTQSRLQIPTDVLFTRLSALRPLSSDGVDGALRAKFVNLESRLLYLQFGPSVLADCPFCASDEPRSYLYYALPSLLGPHLVNLGALSLATSLPVSGPDGARWRSLAAIAAALGAVLDVYVTSAYNYQLNARAARLGELDMFFWSSRAWRGVLLASLDVVVAGLVYLSSTRRAFARPPSPASRVEAATRQLLANKSRLNAVGIVKNTAIRDEELRGRAQAYWQHEGRLMREVMEERDVLEGVNDALQNRINIQDITHDADVYATNVLPPVPHQDKDKDKDKAPATTVG
ncbi:hypothetical protein F4810DRAFT_646395 [Camillea tinctor]|nr:hypothetical protein F4810DRAFT_646395 [Camillea tinctor]